MSKIPRPAPARHLSSLKPQARLDPGKLQREKDAHLKERERKRIEDAERVQLALIAEQKAMAEALALASVSIPEDTEPNDEGSLKDVAPLEPDVGDTKKEIEPASEPSGDSSEEEPAPPEGENLQTSGGTNKTEVHIPNLLDGTNSSISTELATGAWDKLLPLILAAEAGGKNRRGAKDAIEARITLLG